MRSAWQLVCRNPSTTPPPSGDVAPSLVVEYVDTSGNRQTTTVVNGVTSITGVAPFLVQFNGSGTRAATAFAAQSAITDAEAYAYLMVGYRLNYGEGVGGSWTYPAGTSYSKDEDTGPPMFGYIYRNAGTYTPRMKVRDALGNESTIQFTLVVNSPPAATAILVAAGAWPTWASNTRYTLEAGGNYTSFGEINTGGLHNIIIEKTGSGANPIIESFNPDARSKFSATNYVEYRAAHIRLINIEMNNFSLGQRGYDYVGVIGGLIKKFNDSGVAYLWHESTDIIQSNARYSRGTFFQDTEVRSTTAGNGYVMFFITNSFHARNTRFDHLENGPTTYAMLRIYGSNCSYRNNLWYSTVDGGSANGTVISLLAIGGVTEAPPLRSDDNVGPLGSTSSDQNYGCVNEKDAMQHNQIYAASSFLTNALSSVGGGNPSGANVVRPRLQGWEDNVFYPSGDIALLTQIGQLFGQYNFWRNNRKNMGAGAYISSSTGAPNASVGDFVTFNGPFFQEDANTRPVPTAF